MGPKRKLHHLAHLLVCLLVASGMQVYGAGVTIITHGLNSSIDDWVISMAGKIPAYSRFPGTNFSCYEINFTNVNNVYVPTWKWLSGSTTPLATDSGEIIIKLDWRQLANNSYSTYQVASSVIPTLLQPGFISQFPGHALAELPLHLVGHSRGGSLICEMSRLLGTNGVWVDHLTTFDPHPLNNDGFADFPFTVVDAPAHTYENVLFHDNYFQKIDSLFFGEAVAGAYTRQLKNLDGGYSGIGGAHSDVHLWYHGTIDLQTPTSDTVSTITSTERAAWWNGNENFGVSAGFLYSRIGGGDRLGTNQPAGVGTSHIRDGYNQRWDLGAGNDTNRTILSTNRGTWPNLITAGLPAPRVMVYGQSNALKLFYQWVQPAASNARVDLFLDEDFSPFNGNERHLQSMFVPGTPTGLPGNPVLPFTLDVANSSPGVHSVFARITANGKTRYFYAPQTLTVMSSFAPPTVTLANADPAQVQIGVDGIAGQRIVLERSANLLNWQPIATNWLNQARWTYIDPASLQNFYRAAVR